MNLCLWPQPKNRKKVFFFATQAFLGKLFYFFLKFILYKSVYSLRHCGWIADVQQAFISLALVSPMETEMAYASGLISGHKYIHFLCMLASTLLNRYGDSVQPCLVSGFSGIAFTFSLFKFMLTMGLL